MGVYFRVGRTAPEGYRRLMAGEGDWDLVTDHIAISGWQDLFVVLKYMDDPLLQGVAARSMCGGEPTHLGATYSSAVALSPRLVADIARVFNGYARTNSDEIVDPLDEAEVRHRHARLIDLDGARFFGDVDDILGSFGLLRDAYRAAADANNAAVI